MSIRVKIRMSKIMHTPIKVGRRTYANCRILHSLLSAKQIDTLKKLMEINNCSQKHTVNVWKKVHERYQKNQKNFQKFKKHSGKNEHTCQNTYVQNHAYVHQLANPAYLIISKANRYFKEINGNKYLKVKSVKIQSYFWSVFSCIWTFPVFWSVFSCIHISRIFPYFLRIQSEYRKIRTRNNSVFGYFLHIAN